MTAGAGALGPPSPHLQGTHEGTTMDRSLAWTLLGLVASIGINIVFWFWAYPAILRALGWF